MRTKVLIVEDNPARIASFRMRLRRKAAVVFVRGSREGISKLRSKTIDVLFLDHDLDGSGLPQPSGAGTGYEVAAWLSLNPTYVPDHVYVHSANPDGVANILRVLPCAKAWPDAWKEV